MKNLTERQRQVLDFIAQFIDDNKSSPTVREIGEHFSFSLRAVQDHVSALKKKGYISVGYKKSRSIKVLQDLRKGHEVLFSLAVPVLIKPKSGKALLAPENIQTSIRVSEPLVHEGSVYYALKVVEPTMTKVGIMPGDYAVFRYSTSAYDGDIVLAYHDGKPEIARFFKETSRVRLQTEGEENLAVYYSEVRIIGILASVLRTY